MPYVTQTRYVGSRLKSQTCIAGPAVGSGYAYDSVTGQDDTYSFRTGRVVREGSVISSKLDPLSEVYKPTGNIADRLAYRRRFIERQIALVQSRPGAPSHYLLGDTGHEFASRKIRTTASENTCQLYTTSSGNRYAMKNLDVVANWAVTAGGGTASSGKHLDSFSNYFSGKGFLATGAGATYGMPLATFRGVATNHIRGMNPYKTEVSTVAALLELASGDVPRYLKALTTHLTLIRQMKAAGIRDAAQALGSEYMSNIFGWTPILKDVQGAMDLLLKMDHILFPSDSTRRKVEQTISVRGNTFTGTVSAGMFPTIGGQKASVELVDPMVTSYTTTGGTVQTNRSTGQYTADISVLEELSVFTTARFNTGARPTAQNNGYLDRLRDLLGLELTPKVLWEITPWSWLLDWFLNIGAVIENLTTLGLSNSILNYAYSTARLKNTCSIWGKPTGNTATGVGSITGHFLSSTVTDLKARIAASPFGFGVAPAALSVQQWATLTGLGLARLR